MADCHHPFWAKKRMTIEECPDCGLDSKTMWARKARDMEKEANFLWQTLGRISAMCGTPDAAEGCRSILKLIQETEKSLRDCEPK